MDIPPGVFLGLNISGHPEGTTDVKDTSAGDGRDDEGCRGWFVVDIYGGIGRSPFLLAERSDYDILQDVFVSICFFQVWRIIHSDVLDFVVELLLLLLFWEDRILYDFRGI